MNVLDQRKLMRAGFTIFRKDDYPDIRIKRRSSINFEWQTWENFKTKASRNKRMNELLQSETSVED